MRGQKSYCPCQHAGRQRDSWRERRGRRLLLSPTRSCSHCKLLAVLPQNKKVVLLLGEVIHLCSTTLQPQGDKSFHWFPPPSQSFSANLSPPFIKEGPQGERNFPSFKTRKDYTSFCLLPPSLGGSKWEGEERKQLLSPFRNSVHWGEAWWSGQLSAADGAQESRKEHSEEGLKPVITYQQKQKKRIDPREG